MKKAYIQTYGCQMNEHDTYRMAGLLVAEGYEMTEEVDDANLVLVNTCSVRHNPENKVYSQLGRLRDLKKTRDDLIIGVGGCVAQQEGEAILKLYGCDPNKPSFARACLLANHGQVATGSSLEEAMKLASLVEELAHWHWGALAIGGPKLLSARQMAEVTEAFASYGQQDELENQPGQP